MSSLPVSYPQMLKFLLQGSGIWAMLLVAMAAIIWKTLSSGWFWWDALVISGFFVFRGAVEWVIHSWLYHANPLPFLGLRLNSDTHRQHIEHHENPSDLARLLITWKGVVVLAALVFVGAAILFRSADVAATMVLGFVVVGIMIEVVHLICHCRIPHRSAVMQRLVRLHRIHHHYDGGNFYGVSSSLGDRWFGTYPDIVPREPHD
ncbi:sterol desaturase family protein [Alcanivorax sp. 1008]|uniref:sterol desaturase family protein n=1 Tax=Alcanivorax sp. 1008 TaxID=2816853 RepID=UPI001DA913C7|nr:sterol desaturase family protein [Alcanivorax sp. 1008]MCC1498058.1 sterol desaturase family protein [Alcanivorax sp. 1008]